MAEITTQKSGQKTFSPLKCEQCTDRKTCPEYKADDVCVSYRKAFRNRKKAQEVNHAE